MKLIAIVLCFISISTTAQVGIKADNTAPISSAQLEVQSTNKAFYPPRMTNAQVKAIASPQVGAVVFDTDLNCLSMYNGTTWICTGAGGSDQNGGGQGNVPGTFSLSKMNANAAGYGSMSESTTGASGIIYMTGRYNSTGPTTLYNLDASVAMNFPTSAGTDDGFVAAFTPAGSIQWAARVSGAGDDEINDIAVDATGVTISGVFASTPMTIYNGKATDASPETSWGTLGAGGSNDAFIIRYNNTGVVQWVARQSAAAGMYNTTLCTDGTNIYTLSSAFTTQLTIYNGRASSGAGEVLWGNTSVAAGGASAALVKYSIATGAVVWVSKIEGGILYGDDIAYGNGMVYPVFDAASLLQPYNARTTAVAVETGWGVTTTVGGSDVYLAQYAASTGAVNWMARQAGGGTDYGNKVTADASGNVVIAGRANSLSGNPFYIRQARLTSGAAETNWGLIKSDFDNGQVGFIAKYNSAGSVQWAAHIGGSNSSNIATLNDVAIDKNGSVYLCGGYNSSTADFYNGKTTGTDAESFYQTLPYSANTKGYLIKYTFAGKVEWLSKISNSNNLSAAVFTSIATYQLNASTQPVLSGGGAYVNKIQLGSTVVSTTSGGGDIFWFKYVTSD